jgi:MFS family permease
MFAGGLWVGRAIDVYGPRYIAIIGTFFHVFGLMMASISHEYYQFILSQGLCSAMGASMIFYPALTCVTSWFFRKRALAMGIAASGSGLGGIILPIMVHKLIPQVGFGWTMRICAFLILGLMVVGCATMTSRLPPMPKKANLSALVRPFAQLEFALLGLGAFLTFLALFMPFTFIVTTGVARGTAADIVAYIVPIMNTGSVFGRLLPPFLADKLGRVNVVAVSCLACHLLVLCLWLPSSGTGATIAFAILFGFASGAVVAILPAVVAQISDVREIGLRSGVLFFCVALGVLIGSPIGGQLINSGGERAMQGFGGGMGMLGLVCFLVLRYRLGGFRLSKV